MKIGKNEIRSIYGEAPQSFHNMMVETLDSLDEAAPRKYHKARRLAAFAAAAALLSVGALGANAVIKSFAPVKEGKVREIYDIGDALIMVATDRISAFDVILKNKITKKGTVLTQMSRFWFDYTKNILPNHMLSVDTADMPEYFRREQFAGNSMLCKKLEMLPIECIVRGYITGSGWESYKKNGTVCGITLPEGLRESEKLPEPIYTPSTGRPALGTPAPWTPLPETPPPGRFSLILSLY